MSIDLTANAKQVENLARKIAGGSGSKIVWHHAINAAQAQLDLARVQRLKIALIERVLARGTVDAANTSVSASKLVQRVKRILAGRDVFPEPVRRALPELLRLVRYERRAVLRRDRALREVIKRRSLT